MSRIIYYASQLNSDFENEFSSQVHDHTNKKLHVHVTLQLLTDSNSVFVIYSLSMRFSYFDYVIMQLLRPI